MTRPKIITSHIYPPIPIREYDWCAYRDGHEEDGNYGYGRTEAEAIRELLNIEDDGYKADAIVEAFSMLAKVNR